MTRRSFGAARAASTETPIVFDVAGEEFSVARPLKGTAMLDLADMTDAEGDRAMAAFAAFFRSVLGPQEYKRLRAAADRADLVFGKDQEEDSILGIVRYIVEEAMGRPTEQRSESVDSSSINGTTSPAAVS